MTTKLSHARCDQRQNGRPTIAWYTTISEMTSTCSTTTQDEQVSHGQPLMKTEVPENITSLTHHSLANCYINSLTTFLSVQQQPPKHRRSESLPHPEGSTRGMQQRRQSLHPSFTQPCQTTSDCLLKNFLPLWTDPH